MDIFIPKLEKILINLFDNGLLQYREILSDFLIKSYQDKDLDIYINTLNKFLNFTDFDWSKINENDFNLLTNLFINLSSLLFLKFKELRNYNLDILKLFLPVEPFLKMIGDNSYEEGSIEKFNTQSLFMNYVYKIFFKDGFKNFKKIEIDSVFLENFYERQLTRIVNSKNIDWIEFDLKIIKLKLKKFLIDCWDKYGNLNFLKHYGSELFYDGNSIIEYILKTINILFVYGFWDINDINLLLNKILTLWENLFSIEKEMIITFYYYEIENNMISFRYIISKILMHIILFTNDETILANNKIIKSLEKRHKSDINLIKQSPFIVSKERKKEFKKLEINNDELEEDLNKKDSKKEELEVKENILHNIPLECITIEYENNEQKNILFKLDGIKDQNNFSSENIKKNNFFFNNNFILQKCLSILLKYTLKFPLDNYYPYNLFTNSEEDDINYKRNKLKKNINEILSFITQEKDNYFVSLKNMCPKYNLYFNEFFFNEELFETSKKFYNDLYLTSNYLIDYNKEFKFSEFFEKFNKINLDFSNILKKINYFKNGKEKTLIDNKNNCQKSKSKKSSQINGNVQNGDIQNGDIEYKSIKISLKENSKISKVVSDRKIENLNQDNFAGLENEEIILFKLSENGSLSIYLNILNELNKKLESNLYPYNEIDSIKNVMRNSIKQFSLLFSEISLMKYLFSLNGIKLLENLSRNFELEVFTEINKVLKYTSYKIILEDKNFIIKNFLFNKYASLLKELNVINLKSTFSKTINYNISERKKEIIFLLSLLNNILYNIFDEINKNKSENIDYEFQKIINKDINNFFYLIGYYFNDFDNNELGSFDDFYTVSDYEDFKNFNIKHLVLNWIYTTLNLFNKSISNFITFDVYNNLIQEINFDNLRLILNFGVNTYLTDDKNIYLKKIGPKFRLLIINLVTNLFIFSRDKIIYKVSEDEKENEDFKSIPEAYSHKEFYNLINQDFNIFINFKNNPFKKDKIFQKYLEEYLFKGYFPFIVKFIRGITKLLLQNDSIFLQLKHYFKKFIADLRNNLENIKVLLNFLKKAELDLKLVNISNLFITLGNYLNIKDNLTFKSSLVNRSKKSVRDKIQEQTIKQKNLINPNLEDINKINEIFSLNIELDYKKENKIFPEINNLNISANYIIDIIAYIYKNNEFENEIKFFIGEKDDLKQEEEIEKYNVDADLYLNSKIEFKSSEENEFFNYLNKELYSSKDNIEYFIIYLNNSIFDDIENNKSILNKNVTNKINFLKNILSISNNYKDLLYEVLLKDEFDLIINLYQIFKNIALFLTYKPFKDKNYFSLYENFDSYRTFFQETCENNFFKFKRVYNSDEIQLNIFGDYLKIIEKIFTYSLVWKNKNDTLIVSDRKDLFKLASDLIYSFREFLGSSVIENSLEVLTNDQLILNFKGILERNIHDLTSQFYDLKYQIIEFFLYLLEGEDYKILENISKNLNLLKLYENMAKMIELLNIRNHNLKNSVPKVEKMLNKRLKDLKKWIKKELKEKKYEKDSKNQIKKIKHKVQDNNGLTLFEEKGLIERNIDRILIYFTNRIKNYDSFKIEKKNEETSEEKKKEENVEEEENVKEENDYIISSPNELLINYVTSKDFNESLILKISIDYYILLKNLKQSSNKLRTFLNEKENLLYLFRNELNITFLTGKKNLVQGNEENFEENNESSNLENDLKIYSFLHYIVRPLEIINNKKELVRYYFPLVPKTFFLNDQRKNEFLNELTYESTVSNQKEIIFSKKIFDIEMKNDYKIYLKSKILYKIINKKSIFVSKVILWLIAFIQNIFILISYTKNNTGIIIFTQPFWGPTINALSILIIVISAFYFIIFSSIKLKEKYLIHKTQFLDLNGIKEYNKFYNKFLLSMQALFNNSLIAYIFHLIFGFLAIFVNNFFASLHLFMIIFLNSVMKDIFISAVVHYDQLLLSLLFAILILFVYTIIVSQYYVSDLGDNDYCSSIFYCFLNVVSIGIRNGFTGDLKILQRNDNTGRKAGRFFFDFSFFFIITTIFLNIIQGIIVDTFASKKEENDLKEEKKNNFCTICGLERDALEKKDINFNYHVNKVHDPFNYVYFLLFLKIKEEKEYNSLDIEISEKNKKNDYNWVPNNRTKDLDNLEQDAVEDLVDSFNNYLKIKYPEKYQEENDY